MNPSGPPPPKAAPKKAAKTTGSGTKTDAKPDADSDEHTSPLGQIIRQERSRQGMTLDDLARMSGVSKGMLSQIEQSKTNPTVTVLLRIAAGLRVEPTRLLPTTRHAPRVWRSIRANDEAYRFPANEGCLIRTLSPLDLEKQIELYELTFQPKGGLISEPHYQGTEEILTVVSGKLIVRSGDQENELRKGDSQHYAADVPHQIVNVGSTTASGILLVWYRS